ncbi:hypothetical protein PR048_010146 [Dryococelus australis]|uniref:Uncharacterized protein n=1 Tax=Dryococelus australis TaxID=614101 RepID=A0ABQ9I210_9NEOP|nr:hypothetical protein PR048_010146 [Dryococelus australis]
MPSRLFRELLHTPAKWRHSTYRKIVPRSVPGNRKHFAARSSQLYTMPVPRASRNQSENGPRGRAIATTFVCRFMNVTTRTLAHRKWISMCESRPRSVVFPLGPDEYTISFENTHSITNIKSAPKKLAVYQGKIKQAETFKYLGEWIEPNICEKEAFVSSIKKLEIAYHFTKDVYNKRLASFNAKLRHYRTVIRPEALYAAEFLAMNKKGLMEQLEARERKILRKILGPVKEMKITDTMRERRIAFYGHLTRTSSERLSNQIFTYFLNKKTKGVWFTEVEKNLQELGISHDDILERDRLKKKLQRYQGLKPKMKTDKVWTEERREAHRKRMQEYWTNSVARVPACRVVSHLASLQLMFDNEILTGSAGGDTVNGWSSRVLTTCRPMVLVGTNRSARLCSETVLRHYSPILKGGLSLLKAVHDKYCSYGINASGCFGLQTSQGTRAEETKEKFVPPRDSRFFLSSADEVVSSWRTWRDCINTVEAQENGRAAHTAKK